MPLSHPHTVGSNPPHSPASGSPNALHFLQKENLTMTISATAKIAH